MKEYTPHLLAIFFIFCLTHGTYIFSKYPTIISNKWKTEMLSGDALIPEQGALSIIEFSPERKFNNKTIYGRNEHQQKVQIKKDDFSPSAPFFLVAYPYSSFRYAYSLYSAFISKITLKFFDSKMPRVLLCNSVLNLCTILIIFYILRKSNVPKFSSTIISSLVLFDYNTIYNSYSYLNHFSAAFFSIIAGFAIAISNKLNYTKMFISSFFLGIGVFSGSHVFFLGVFLSFASILVFLRTSQKEWRKILAIAFLGFFATPIYIFLVEWIYNFEKLGLRTWLYQQQAYFSDSSNISRNYFSLKNRLIWDLSILIPTWKINLLFVLISMLFFRGTEKFQPNLISWQTIKNKILKNPFAIFILGMIFHFILMSYFGLPISRVMVPFTFSVFLILSYFLISLLKDKKRSSRVIAIFSIFLLVSNYYIFRYVDKNGDLLNRKAPKITFNLDNKLKPNKTTKYNWISPNFLPPNSLYYFSCDLKTMIGKIKEDWNKENRGCFASDDLWIKIDFANLITPYIHPNRLRSETIQKEFFASDNVIKNDFRAIFEILEKMRVHEISKNDFIKCQKIVFNISNWNAENEYLYIYKNDVFKNSKDKEMQTLSTHDVIFIKFKALQNSIKTKTNY